jgi:hypothetical protein
LYQLEPVACRVAVEPFGASVVELAVDLDYLSLIRCFAFVYPTGAFVLSHENRLTHFAYLTGAFNLSTETPKWKLIYEPAHNTHKG